MIQLTGNMIGTVLALFCQVIASSAEAIGISTYPSDKFIFIGEKTIVNSTVRFLNPVYEDVHVTLYPSMDGPDIYMRRILGVHIGRNLEISGKVLPLMDWGNKNSVPGEYLACEYFLGTVKRKRKSWKLSDDVITFQYEAIMGAEGTYEEGDDHMFGVSVKSADDFNIIQKHVTMRSRTLPLLFRALNKENRLNPSVMEMWMAKVNGTRFE